MICLRGIVVDEQLHKPPKTHNSLCFHGWRLATSRVEKKGIRHTRPVLKSRWYGKVDVLEPNKSDTFTSQWEFAFVRPKYMYKSPDNLRRLVCITYHSSNMIFRIVRTHPTFSLHEVCGSLWTTNERPPKTKQFYEVLRRHIVFIGKKTKFVRFSVFEDGLVCEKQKYRPLKHKASCSENKDERVWVKTRNQWGRIRTCTPSATLRPWRDLRGQTTDHSHPQARHISALSSSISCPLKVKTN